MLDTHQSQKLTFREILRSATDAADRKKWELAASLFAQAVPLDPSSGVIIQYGHMLKEAGYLEEAVSAYRAALVWDVTAGDGYVHLGHLLKRLGRTQEAIETFRAAERIPYGPHVSPEINGLIVAQLNASHALRRGQEDVLRTMPDDLQKRDEVLHRWLADQYETRRKAARCPAKTEKASLAFGRKRLRCSLEPAIDLVIEEGTYRATTGNPRMRIQIAKKNDLKVLRGQWIDISLTITETECVVDPILYVEEVPGRGGFKTARLKKRSRNTYGAMILLSQSLISLRLDPVHTPGTFIISDLEVFQLSWPSAFRQLLSKRDRPSLIRITQAALHGDLSVLLEDHLGIETADDYGRWIAFNERQYPQASTPALDDCGGTIGFVSLVKSDNGGDYSATVASLFAQTSKRWKLVFVLDENLSSSLRAAIEQDAAGDERLTVSVLAPASPTAIRIETAMTLLNTELISLLPPGDVLAKGAVASFLECMKANPAVAAIYCDHDEIDKEGLRHSPRFKPDWNRDYILCYDYIGPAVLFSSPAIYKAGGWRDKFPGMEILDLLLRVSNATGADVIRHLAKPVWHCRRSEVGRDIVPTVNDFLAQQNSGICAKLGRIYGTARLKWPMPTIPPHVTIIIPTRDRIELLRTTINSILLKTDYPSFDIVVIDNGSVEVESLDYFTNISRDNRISILRDDGPFNFSRLNNRAAAIAKGSVLALVNNDVEVKESNWLEEMVAIAIDPDVGAVGAKLLYASGHLQHAGMVGGVGAVAGHGHKYEPADAEGYMNRLVVQQTVIAVTAACLVVEAEKYRAVDGLNEENLAVAFNDVDLCLRLAERGWRSIFTPWAVLYHHESLSRGLDLSGERGARFGLEAGYMRQVWGDKILNDRFYSQNLTLDHEDFSFRC